jgi:surface polysaccharide O-acyltransferase-like enzyme
MIAQNNQLVICGHCLRARGARGEQTRPYIYELDLMRPVTAVTVVAVHVLAFTLYLNDTAAGVQVQNGIITSVHFTREVFMFITAFALTYVYFGRPFSAKRFWTKRSIGVVVPYCIWSIVYTWVNTSQHSPAAFARAALFDILTGNASYQLYYILLTLQLYLVLPLFLLLLKHIQKHPWMALLISFALQVLVMYVDYHYLQQGSLASSGVWKIVAAYQDRFLLTYQFYFILGGLAALHLKQARAFVLSHGKWILSGFVLALAALWVHFLLQVDVYHESQGYATSVLQPMMTFYSPVVIVLLCWLASRWVSWTDQQGHPKGYRFWHSLSDASFGIYLVHAFILTALLRWVVPFMPEAWPVALRVFLTWFLTAGGAAGISILLMKTPVLSHLVGRSACWRSSWCTNALHEWFSNTFLAACLSEARTHFVGMPGRLHKIITFHHQRKVEQKGSGDA